ncbi:hypothetical protein JAAARDRAFT_114811, partial [Jaapia argillacea MUCL 33604]
SPTPHLLRTNIPPRVDQILEIRTFLIQQQLQIDPLDAELPRLQAQIDALTQDRQRLQSHQEAHTRVLAGAIKRLPPGLPSKIFVNCLDVDSRTIGVPGIRRVPILLTKVCRVWREVVIKTSTLW